MVVVPAAIAVTSPVEGSIVATPVVVLLQVPLPVASANVVVKLVHNVVVPVMAAGADGKELIVTVVVTDVLPQLLVTV
jgi:hypothetical protein